MELVWDRVRVEGECFWVNLRKDNKVSESKMAVFESNMAEFKMAAIINLIENEWVKFFCTKWLNWGWQISRYLQSSSWVRMNEWSFFVLMLVPTLGNCEWVWEKELRWQNSRWLPSSSWVRMNEWSSFCAKWLNPRWQSSRWLPSSSWVRMNEFESDWTSLSQSFVQNGWIQDGRIQDGRIQDGCHH